MIDVVKQAIKTGAVVFASVSGGKDGQAMVRTLINNRIPIGGLLHCDLGRAEWPQSITHCQKQAAEYNLPLHLLYRRDGVGLIEYMKRRKVKLAGTGKPFWPSADARYCTSDLKRGPSDYFLRKCGHGLIISAEGIRAQESIKRASKTALSVRPGVTSDYYSYLAGYNRNGKPIRKFYTVEECLRMYRSDKRLVLTWYPILNMTVDEVWATYGMTSDLLAQARKEYRLTARVPTWWPFHPAYVFGNDRVSCMFCVLASKGDLQNGKDHNPALYRELVQMETETGFTFKANFSLTELRE